MNSTMSQSSPNPSTDSSGYDSPTRILPRQSTVPVMTSKKKREMYHRQMSLQVNMSSVEFSVQNVQRKEQPRIGNLRPELYKTAIESNGSDAEGRINFTIKYDHQFETLIINIIKAIDLPAKDFSGTSDPYVKLYLLPDRKRKFQTKVHRKNLNPTFDESFSFNVPFQEVPERSLQLSIYDFDRFSRHDSIGQVVVKNLMEKSDLSVETEYWMDIQKNTHEDKADLGELMFSLCYLPTAGRLTLTVIKARNLKAMDITGASDPYVKISLMCQGKRLKKKKTTVKKNTLNPVYNEAIVFDVPPEVMDQIALLVAVVDYDRVGHSELIGVTEVGPNSCGIGGDHWGEMIAQPRKPIAYWHPLLESVATLNSGSMGSLKGCMTPQQSFD
uniref:Synaptotagmin-6-like n=1 Tax=Saccoglossus kowalevskii TaxID=10224 RepID=A0ABM0MF93_SACKO|nr:PREDICTED: synaptotagmin-6-like [Saccoglossus kowalevskii]